MARLSKEADAAYHKAYRERNRTVLREKAKQRYWLNAEKGIKKNISLEQRKNRSEYNKLYALKYPEKRAFNEAKRRAYKFQATPKWLNTSHYNEIEEIYSLCTELSWLSEGGLEVDHIVPLKGKHVSGLHVPWNLQIIPAIENRRKSNRF